MSELSSQEQIYKKLDAGKWDEVNNIIKTSEHIPGNVIGEIILCAVRDENINALKLLNDKGIDLNKPDQFGETALTLAKGYSKSKEFEALLKELNKQEKNKPILNLFGLQKNRPGLFTNQDEENNTPKNPRPKI